MHAVIQWGNNDSQYARHFYDALQAATVNVKETKVQFNHSTVLDSV